MNHELCPDEITPGDWRVEAVGEDGEVYVAIFSGPNAESRATAYQRWATGCRFVDIVFDGPPSHEAGRFVEVEDENGASIKAGEWIESPPYWRLRIATEAVAS